MKPQLTIKKLIEEANKFSKKESNRHHPKLYGVTDGKAIGTYFEHNFKEHLYQNYTLDMGNSASGIDLPDEHLITDIKVTSFRQPQSSSPFKDAKQKIFGLGYNLLVFVYIKDDSFENNFHIVNCTFIDKDRTADFTTSKRLIEMLNDGAIKEDILSYLMDRNIPGDDITLNRIADEIIESSTLKQGVLTISNALQWRIQYKRAISSNNDIQGVINFDF